jgi:bla regulator protein BlaR1
MAIGQSTLLQALGWAVFNSLWQMAILWVAYQFIIPLFRINKSSHKGFLAAFLLFAGFGWFLFTLISAFAENNPANNFIYLLNINGSAELNNWFSTMLPVASILYLLLLILPILNFIRNYRYVQVIRRYGLYRANVEWRMFVQKISAQMGIRKPVYIWMSELVTSPVTIGYLKPVILLPLAAVNRLTQEQTEAVLLHELAHIRRYDYFVNLLTKLIQTILYYNPFVKAFSKIIQTEREKSCDETVMQFQYEPHGYASALLVLEKEAHVSRHSLAVGASDGRKTEFRQRIEWIMGIHKKPGFSFQKLAGVLAGLLCFIALNALLIISKPGTSSSSKESFTFLPSSYELLANDYNKTTSTEPVIELKNTIINVPTDPVAQSKGTGTKAEIVLEINDPAPPPSAIAPIDVQDAIASAFNYVYNLQTVIPKLNAEEEKQVQQAIVESKKVLQEIQWKEVEKGIADALTGIEKVKVKEQYKKAMDQIDWNKIEDRLRIAYDNIDWKKINYELDNALAEIKLDSLQQVYTLAIDQVSNLQKELVKVNQPGIPDTDITIKSLEDQKKQMKKAIENIRVIRPKKVVHL